MEGNLERALSEEPRPGAERKLVGRAKAIVFLGIGVVAHHVRVVF